MPTEYRRRTKAQFDVLEQENRTQWSKLDAIVVEIKPVLNCVDLEVDPQPDGRPPHPDTIIDRCKAAWENFKSFNRDATISTVAHALAVVRSHYPTIDL